MALVRKILEATIPSGGSSATFTDSDIPNSLIRVYSTNSNIYPQNISLTGNTLTVTYEPVTSNMGVAVELVKQGLEIDDNLTSDNTDHALSAKQGKVLKGLIDGLDIPDNITDLADVDVTDIEDGQVLAWDDTAQKYVNVNQSGGGGSQEYSVDTSQPFIVGTVGEKTLYRQYIAGELPSNSNSTTIFSNYSSSYSLLNVFGEVRKNSDVIQLGGMLYGYTDSWNASIMIQSSAVQLWYGNTFKGGTYKIWLEYYV